MPKRREVILAHVFFSDSPQSKVRPAIVLSSEDYNARTGFLIIAPVTTSKDEYCLEIKEADATCGFQPNSAARFDCAIRIHERQTVRPLGNISAELYRRLVEKITETIR